MMAVVLLFLVAVRIRVWVLRRRAATALDRPLAKRRRVDHATPSPIAFTVEGHDPYYCAERLADRLQRGALP